jgi:putative membrane protein
MIRFLITTLVSMAASAVGLIVAAVVLDDMTLNGAAFIIAVVIFTITTAIINPFILKTTMRKAQALMGASSLLTTFVGLVVTSLLSDGLSISGADTWLFATLIVWLATLLAAWIIPIILVKQGVESLRQRNN